MVYDNRHRKFLQFIMQAGSVSDQDASLKAMEIFNQRINVQEVATDINDKLDPLAMMIKSGMCELTGDKFWSLVNTSYEESVTIPSSMKEPQKAFLRTIYSELISSETGRISSMECLNLTTTIDSKISLGDADDFLKNIVKQRWLYLDEKNGYYHMGIRSILELMPYFKATFQDNFHTCSLCREVLFHGQKCENCEKLFHYYCVAKFMKVRKDNKCPNCNTAWDTSHIPERLNATSAQRMEQTVESMDVSDEHEKEDEPVVNVKKSKRTRKH